MKNKGVDISCKNLCFLCQVEELIHASKNHEHPKSGFLASMDPKEYSGNQKSLRLSLK